MAEGLRWMDLIRWRSLEQMCKEPYHVEGFRLWDVMQNEYDLKPADYDGGKDALLHLHRVGNISLLMKIFRNNLICIGMDYIG